MGSMTTPYTHDPALRRVAAVVSDESDYESDYSRRSSQSQSQSHLRPRYAEARRYDEREAREARVAERREDEEDYRRWKAERDLRQRESRDRDTRDAYEGGRPRSRTTSSVQLERGMARVSMEGWYEGRESGRERERGYTTSPRVVERDAYPRGGERGSYDRERGSYENERERGYEKESGRDNGRGESGRERERERSYAAASQSPRHHPYPLPGSHPSHALRTHAGDRDRQERQERERGYSRASFRSSSSSPTPSPSPPLPSPPSRYVYDGTLDRRKAPHHDESSSYPEGREYGMEEDRAGVYHAERGVEDRAGVYHAAVIEPEMAVKVSTVLRPVSDERGRYEGVRGW